MIDDNLTPRPVDDDAQQAAEPSAADAIDLNEMEEAPQTPEEIAAIEAADKQRARNINKIFAAMMTTLVLIFVLFLAIYIPWRKDQNQLPGATLVLCKWLHRPRQRLYSSSSTAKSTFATSGNE